MQTFIYSSTHCPHCAEAEDLLTNDDPIDVSFKMAAFSCGLLVFGLLVLGLIANFSVAHFPAAVGFAAASLLILAALFKSRATVVRFWKKVLCVNSYDIIVGEDGVTHRHRSELLTPSGTVLVFRQRVGGFVFGPRCEVLRTPVREGGPRFWKVSSSWSGLSLFAERYNTRIRLFQSDYRMLAALLVTSADIDGLLKCYHGQPSNVVSIRS